MNQEPHDTPITEHVPALCTLDPQTARLVFQRTLASWAGDLLMLRHRGLLRPAWGNAAGDGPDWSEAA